MLVPLSSWQLFRKELGRIQQSLGNVMPRREDVERGKCGLCWLSSTASHIQACVGGRTLVSCGKTIPVSLPHPNNVKMWPQHRILLAEGRNWCLVEIPLLFLHPPSFLCGAEMEEAQGGHCPTLLCLGVASPQALRAFWGPKTCQSCRSIWTAQDGMLGCDPCGSPPTQDIPEF